MRRAKNRRARRCKVRSMFSNKSHPLLSSFRCFFFIGERVYRYSVGMLTICITSLVIGPPATQCLPPRGWRCATRELLVISLKCGPTYDVTTHEWLRENFTSNLANIGISNSHKTSPTGSNFILIPENKPRELVNVFKK